MAKKIAIGGDHASPEYKEAIVEQLKAQGYEVEDFGTYTTDSCDYPDYAHKVAKAVNDGEFELGILICGSANGVAMTANKYPNVRAGLAWNSEIVGLIRQHNDANILCVPARFTSKPQAIGMVETFLSTEFEGGRHQNRVNKIPLSC
ncbi:ribose 5-phosphate isomerase B [Aureibacter tunicatorum]|uniref:Ribose 5-phosphate isomerase B n=1 Tax=Aureibacter tunicatorum TaxID=866807 RepID=A0AAE4BRE1_9BACT|nr:ribose 5-phosphate isomerase B [Aureibacter tunicatorum]MDR6237685.1 ribose 5-phosphate isomerase B [Aureibacter tunicatorum]BDD02720.1 ribose 5-phosphate isomerase B [Aureibacter tunicatorum]